MRHAAVEAGELQQQQNQDQDANHDHDDSRDAVKRLRNRHRVDDVEEQGGDDSEHDNVDRQVHEGSDHGYFLRI